MAVPQSTPSPLRRSYADAVGHALADVHIPPLNNGSPDSPLRARLIDYGKALPSLKRKRSVSPTTTIVPPQLHLVNRTQSPYDDTIVAAASSTRALTATRSAKSTRKANRAFAINNTISEWSRIETFDYKDQPKHKLNNNRFDAAAFAKHESLFSKQLAWRFQRQNQSDDDRADAIGLGSRSSVANDLFLDDDARKVETTAIKRLSICHWEDVLAMQSGQKLVIQFRHNKMSDLQKAPFNSNPLKAAAIQQDKAIAGGITKIGGIKFLTLKAEILSATLHHEAVAGDMTPAQLQVHFRQKAGFTIKYIDTGITQTFQWKHLVDLREQLKIFGPSLDGSRRYNLCFTKKTNIVYVKRVFWGLSQETWGDVYASSALYNAYLKRILELERAEMERVKQYDELLQFNETQSSKHFFKAFDNMCRRSLFETVSQLRDFNSYIIHPVCFDTYVEEAEHSFPRLWKHVCVH